MKSLDPVKVLTVRGTSFEAVPVSDGSAVVEKGPDFPPLSFLSLFSRIMNERSLAPDVDMPTDLSEFLGQEISKSERAELTSASTVISGGSSERGVR